MKSEIKKFLRKNGINTIVVNKRTLKLDQAKTIDLINLAFANGYQKEL